MKRIGSIMAILLMAFVSAQAQLISWSVPLGKYEKIEPCWGDLYCVYSDNHVGVIYGDGRPVVALEASRITGFHDGVALVLKSTGGQERIMGILHTSGKYVKVEGCYYTIPYQEFFSEGLLSVVGENGKAGFLDADGMVVKTFNTPFVSPFSEGYAVVGENQDYMLVDKSFQPVDIRLGTVAKVYGGTNVFNGSAIIWDSNGRFYQFDLNSGLAQKISEPKSLDYDYLYCFSSITKRTAEVAYEATEREKETLAVSAEGEKYGYATDEKVILPYQFDEAENFHGHYAIVKKKGEAAILKLHQTQETFKISSDKEIKYRRSASKNQLHRFSMILPSLWNENDVEVVVKDNQGVTMGTSKRGGVCEFKADGTTGSRKYHVSLACNDLLLWQGDIDYRYTIEPEPVVIQNDNERHSAYKPLTVTLKAQNTQADKNNRCYVLAKITNPNPDPITTQVTMTGSNLLEAVSVRVTVPALGTKDVSTYFIVKKAVSGQKVTVTTAAGGSASLDGLQLIPF